MSRANRIHLIAHANPIGKDVGRFEFASLRAYLDHIRAHLPRRFRLTCAPRLLDPPPDAARAGRADDADRARDLQNALNDPQTVAIVAASGGAYFTRILPQVDFSPLARRERPLWAFGFSEMTSLVNLAASYRAGRGVYWLCPNYLAWKIRPARLARDAFGEFWRRLATALETGDLADLARLGVDGLEGEVVAGRPVSGRARIIGGCLSVLGPLLCGPLGRRLRARDAWLLIEDINEADYRIDRHLAALKLAGWFEQAAGVLLADFHSGAENQRGAVLELLRFHTPRRLPIVATPTVGHVWPMALTRIGKSLPMRVRGRRVTIGR